MEPNRTVLEPRRSKSSVLGPIRMQSHFLEPTSSKENERKQKLATNEHNATKEKKKVEVSLEIKTIGLGQLRRAESQNKYGIQTIGLGSGSDKNKQNYEMTKLDSED